MILVTGGAGYIGSHAVRALWKHGFETLTFDNFSTGHRDFVEGTRYVEGDICSAADLESVFSRHSIEAVLHFAGKALIAESNRDPELYYRTNVGGGVQLLSAMRRAGVRHIIFSSTCATYGMPASIPILETTPQAPVNPYGETKLAFEKALRWFRESHGIEYLSLRYFNAAGANPEGGTGEDHADETHLIPLVLDAALGRQPEVRILGVDYPTPDGTCIRDYIHVSDLAEAHVLGLRKLLAGEIQSQPINLGTGQGCSVREVVECARRITGMKIPVVESSRRAGDPPILVADVSRASERLGWVARESGIERIISTAWQWHCRRFSQEERR
jgi:UDP-glucose-4-epimerase GalE